MTRFAICDPGLGAVGGPAKVLFPVALAGATPMSAASNLAPLAPAQLLEPAVDVGRSGRPPSPELTDRILAQSADVTTLEKHAVYDVLTRALTGHHPHLALQWLRDAGVLVHLLPELDATVAFSQEGGRRHKDVWDHTKTVVRQSVPRPVVRWSAVLHDIGKVMTRRFLPGGKVTFRGHAEEGVRMFRRGPARRIGFPDDMRSRIEDLIRYHLRPGQYDGTWTDGAVRRFARDMGPRLTDLMDLSRADVTSKRPGQRKRCLALISELGQRIEKLNSEDARPRPLPPGLGNLLMTELTLPPGKHIGDLRDRLQALCEAGELLGGQPPGYYVEAVRGHGLLDGLEIRPPRGFGP